MLGLCLFVTFLFFYRVKFDEAQQYFMTKEYSDNWKGILCIMIMISHILELYHWPNILYNIHSFAYIFVALFFMFSGYGLKYSYNHNPDYIKVFISKRWLRVYIPYLLCNIFVDLILRKVILLPEEFGVTDIVEMIFCVNARWFIQVLLILYLIFWVSFKFFPKQGNIIVFVSIFIFIIVGACLKIDKQRYGSLIPFAFGIVMADGINDIRLRKINKVKASFAIVLAGVFEILYALNKESIWLGTVLFRNCLCVVIVIGFLEISKIIKNNNPISRFFGKISYEFFLVHIAALLIVKYRLAFLPIDVQAIIIFAFSTAIAYVMNIVDKRVINILSKVNFKI